MAKRPKPAPPPAVGEDDVVRRYLRGVDVPCPACGYNRRDGDAAKCPECGHRLFLTVATGESARVARIGAGWLFGVMIAFGVPGLGYVGLTIMANRAWGGFISLAELIVFVTTAAAFLVAIAFGVWGFRVTRRRLRAGMPEPADARRVRAAGIAMLIALALLYSLPLLAVLL